jgi:tetratricopeptide (TPR) repeat protein
MLAIRGSTVQRAAAAAEPGRSAILVMDLRGWLMRCIGRALIALAGIAPLALGPARADEASDHFRAGVRLLEEHKPRDAVEAFVKVAKLRPNYPQVHACLGDALLELKKYDEAMACYRNSLSSDPPGECMRALNGLGCAYLALATAPKKEEFVRKAIGCFDQAIKLSPKFAVAYNNRGRAYHAKKELDRAIADFGQAIHLDPGYADAFENRGKVWKDKGDKKRGEADFAKAGEMRAKKK